MVVRIGLLTRFPARLRVRRAGSLRGRRSKGKGKEIWKRPFHASRAPAILSSRDPVYRPGN